jgi:hypothetical protein
MAEIEKDGIWGIKEINMKFSCRIVFLFAFLYKIRKQVNNEICNKVNEWLTNNK